MTTYKYNGYSDEGKRGAGVDLEQGKMVDCRHDLESLARQTGKLSAVDWEV